MLCCHPGVYVYCQGNLIQFIALGFLGYICFLKYFSALKKSVEKTASTILNVNPCHHEYLLNTSQDESTRIFLGFGYINLK